MSEDSEEIFREELKKKDLEKTPHYDGPFLEKKLYSTGSPDKGQ